MRTLNKKGGMGLLIVLIVIVGILAYMGNEKFKNFMDDNWLDAAKAKFDDFKNTDIYFCIDSMINATECADGGNFVCGSDGTTYNNPCGACIGKDTSFSYTEAEC